MLAYEKRLWVVWAFCGFLILLPAVALCSRRATLSGLKPTAVLYALLCSAIAGYYWSVMFGATMGMYTWLTVTQFKAMSAVLFKLQGCVTAARVYAFFALAASGLFVADVWLTNVVQGGSKVVSCIVPTVAAAQFMWLWCGAAKENNPAFTAFKSLLGTFVIFLCMIAALAACTAYRHFPPDIGTVDAVVNATSAGRRQIIFHLQDSDGPMPLRNWTMLDADEKIRVKVEIRGHDRVSFNDEKNPPVYWTYAGIEQKGQERTVPNLNLECWESTGDGFDDRDCSFFSVFGNKYEDWWITFGYPADPLHFRQMVANALTNTPHALVDVYTQHSADQTTFEGVGLMVPAFKKGHYENMHRGLRDGKLKCDKDTGEFEDEEPLMLAKYDKGNVNDSRLVRTFTKRKFADSDYSQIYPKASKMQETCSPAAQSELAVKYTSVLQARVATATYPEIVAGETIDSSGFARNWVFEMLLQDTDFAFRSQYFALHGARGAQKLGPGPLWDYNAAGYRGRAHDEPYSITNLYPFFGWDEPLGIYSTICANQAAFAAVEQAEMRLAIADAKRAISDVNSAYDDATLAQLTSAFDQRNALGNTLVGDQLDVHNNAVVDFFFSENTTAEQAYQYNRLARRIAFIEDTIGTTECKVVQSHASFSLIAEVVFFAGGLLTYATYFLYACWRWYTKK
jgi:hypothetical protein